MTYQRLIAVIIKPEVLEFTKNPGSQQFEKEYTPIDFQNHSTAIRTLS